MRIFLIISLSLLCILVNSREREYTVNLEKEKIEIPDFEYYVDRVIDARDTKTCIGFVQSAFGARWPAYFKHFPAEELLQLFSRSFSKSGKPLIIRVNHLFISEFDGTMGIAEINLSYSTYKNSSV